MKRIKELVELLRQDNKWARDNEIDVAVVMAGDAQMDPIDLPSLLDPVVDGDVDYSKGNRLFSGEAYKNIPKARYFGECHIIPINKNRFWILAYH